MNFLEEKREENNYLFREYHIRKSDNKYLFALISKNCDLVAYSIIKYFKELKYNRAVYEVGIASMILGIENYEMDNMGSFEEFLIAYIKDGIEDYLLEDKILFVCDNNQECLNMGDIWFNKTHNIEETLLTKRMRDGAVKSNLKKVLQLNKF